MVIIFLFIIITINFHNVRSEMISDDHTTSSSIRFLQIGDWGGIGKPPYYSKSQVKASHGMNKVARQQSSHFIIGSGDNFYDHGIKHVHDPHFNYTWYNIYSNVSPLNKLPWYMIAGNHDHEGNITAQILSSNYYDTWKFPALYYKETFYSVDRNVSVDILFIDTYLLTGVSGIDYPDLIQDMKQYQWIEDTLKSSTADYILINGHYPIYSPCSYGNTRTLITYLQPLLEAYHAHYISGHEHCIAHMEVNHVHYILNGIGNDCCYARHKVKEIPANSLRYIFAQQHMTIMGGMNGIYSGFSSFIITKHHMYVLFHDQDGKILYEATILPHINIIDEILYDNVSIDAIPMDMQIMSK